MSQRPVRMLLATVDYPPIEGGIATVSRELARALAAQGHEVTVLAPALHPTNPQYADTVAFDAAEPVRVVRVRGYEWGALRLLPFWWRGRGLARAADCILAMNITYGGVLGYWARLRHGTPYVAFAYAYEFLKYARRPLSARLLRGLYRNARGTIAISRFTAAQLETFGLPQARIQVAFPGVSPQLPAPPAHVAEWRIRLGIDVAPYVLAVGRLIARKGHLRLIGLWPEVIEAAPGTHLVIVGRGPLHAACAARAEALGIGGMVHLTGYVDDDALAALYSGCSAVALPAGFEPGGQVEGFGLVFTEASAHGKPVVAVRAGGVEDAVRDGETGLLVPPDDDAALLEALRRLLCEPGLAERLGAAGAHWVREQRTWDAFARNVMRTAGAG